MPVIRGSALAISWSSVGSRSLNVPRSTFHGQQQVPGLKSVPQRPLSEHISSALMIAVSAGYPPVWPVPMKHMSTESLVADQARARRGRVQKSTLGAGLTWHPPQKDLLRIYDQSCGPSKYTI